MSRAQLAVGAPVALAVSRWRFARLRRAHPRPFGLAGGPAPMMLSSEGWGPGLTDVVLSYGRLGGVVAVAMIGLRWHYLTDTVAGAAVA